MMITFSSWSAKEARLAYYKTKIVENMKTWGKDTAHTYVIQPLNKGNYGQVVLGVGAAVGGGVFDMIDYGIAGVAGKELPPPGDVPFARLRRDSRELIADALHFEILPTVANVIRLPGSAVMDTVDAAFGFSHDPALQSFQVDTHDQVVRTIEVE